MQEPAQNETKRKETFNTFDRQDAFTSQIRTFVGIRLCDGAADFTSPRDFWLRGTSGGAP